MLGRHGKPLRSIPAHAGNTPRLIVMIFPTIGPSPRTRGTRAERSARRASWSVHPRARGEHDRRRGVRACRLRSIPAHAGNTRPCCTSTSFASGPSPRTRGTRRGPGKNIWGTSVHPRARGEHARRRCRAPRESRSIPAHAGNTERHGPGRRGHQRSIPAHAGNTLPCAPRTLPDHRFIPAHAGNTAVRAGAEVPFFGSSPRTRGTRRARVHDPARGPVHPRARGEHVFTTSNAKDADGSSPRTRGTRRAPSNRPAERPVHPRARGEHCRPLPHAGVVDRFIPAHAGNTTGTDATPDPSIGSSPRTRGTRTAEHPGESCDWFIPAHAGNTGIRVPAPDRCAGSSPRTRGTPCGPRGASARPRFIPAHAGNTSV